jgi:small-conductance mechanosensitive channel
MKKETIKENLNRFIDFVDDKFIHAGEMFKKVHNQIKELEQKANRTGQFHLDAVNEKINKAVELAKEDSAYNHNKIENNARLLQDATRKIFLNIDTINDSVDNNKNDINKIYGLLKSGNIAFKEDYDILEGKYHQLRSELDCVYKVLEMDALDIQDLYEQLENHPKKGAKNAK